MNMINAIQKAEEYISRSFTSNWDLPDDWRPDNYNDLLDDRCGSNLKDDLIHAYYYDDVDAIKTIENEIDERFMMNIADLREEYESMAE